MDEGRRARAGPAVASAGSAASDRPGARPPPPEEVTDAADACGAPPRWSTWPPRSKDTAWHGPELKPVDRRRTADQGPTTDRAAEPGCANRAMASVSSDPSLPGPRGRDRPRAARRSRPPRARPRLPGPTSIRRAADENEARGDRSDVRSLGRNERRQTGGAPPPRRASSATSRSAAVCRRDLGPRRLRSSLDPVRRITAVGIERVRDDHHVATGGSEQGGHCPRNSRRRGGRWPAALVERVARPEPPVDRRPRGRFSPRGRPARLVAASPGGPRRGAREVTQVMARADVARRP